MDTRPTSRVIVLILVLVAAALPMNSARADLPLVHEGTPGATILIPEDADSWTKMAAGWLQEYIEKATGAKLAIAPESRVYAGTLAAFISVGHTKMAAAAGITLDGLEYDAGRMVVKGSVLYLIGRDSPVRDGARPGWPTQPWGYEDVLIARAGEIGPKGTCKAVTAFLEEVCGIRWLAPTPEGVHIPRAKSITVPSDLNRTLQPVFAYGNGRYFYGSPRSSPAAYANNIRTGIRLKTFGGHSYYSWLPAGSYFKDHPEYFAMLQGRRSDKGNHLCTSNPEVRKILLKGLQAKFNAGYDWVQLGQTDGFDPCQCPTCSAQDDFEGVARKGGESPFEYERRLREHGCERLHDTHKWIADQAMKSHPDKTILMLSAYSPLVYPSARFEKYPDNVVCEIHGGATPKYIEAWRGQGRGMAASGMWLTIEMPPGLAVRFTPEEASNLIRYFADAKVAGIYFMGGGVMWGLQGPTYYVTGRMMGDPKRDCRELVAEYCEGLYGSASEPMLAFFNMLHSRHTYPLFQKNLTAPDIIRTVYQPLFVMELESLLKKAERAAKTHRERMWIKMSRDEFDYIRHMSRMLKLYDAYLLIESPDVLQHLKRTVGEFNQYRRRVTAYDGDHVRLYFPGHGMTCKYLTTGINSGNYYAKWPALKPVSDFSRLDRAGVGFLYSTIGKPLTLDFDTLQDGLGFFIKPTTAAVSLDGEMDEPDWQKARPVFMRGAVGAEMRGLYDRENLYVFYKCEEPKIDTIKVGETGRDGPAHRMECIELFLAPESSSFARRYYHFIVAPAKNAFYDDRTGFKTANDQDETWNAPGFAYGFHIDKKNKAWTLELKVPFKDLAAPPPRPGDTWIGNHARERRVGALELYQWSKGGTSGFCDPRSFARFRFE